MDIQQWEKESLAAYVHQFKTQAKRCNFMNDTATIRNFIKGPRNAHNLAARIYEKDPQTLRDAITETEKLNTAQQPTSTIISSSTVNMISNEDDWCFQCQEPGHIAWHCTALTSDVINVMNMDTLSWTALIKYPLQEHQCHITRHIEITTPDQALDTAKKMAKEDRSRSQSRYSRHCSSSCCDLYRGHSRSQQRNGYSCYRGSSRQSHSAHQGHRCRTHHDTPHWPHHRSSTHCSSSGYCSPGLQ